VTRDAPNPRTPHVHNPPEDRAHALTGRRAERLSAAPEQLLDGIDKLMTSEGW